MRFSKTSTVGWSLLVAHPGVGLDGGTYIHDATVDVSEFLEAKQPRAVGGVIEGVGLMLVSN